MDLMIFALIAKGALIEILSLFRDGGGTITPVIITDYPNANILNRLQAIGFLLGMDLGIVAITECGVMGVQAVGSGVSRIDWMGQNRVRQDAV